MGVLPLPRVGEQRELAHDERITTDVETGVFGARMEVELVNDGPVTIVVDG